MKTALKKAPGISFIILRLKDDAGNVVSRNTYWLEKNNDLKGLQQMASSSVQAILVDHKISKTDHTYTFALKNETRQLAFFKRLQLMYGDEEVLPSFWSANYITLAPGESAEVTVSVPSINIKPEFPALKISGWNGMKK